MPAVRQKLHLSSCADFRSRLLGSILGGAVLLIALVGSSILLKPHVDFALLLSLLIALALIDQALKSLRLIELRLAPGLFLSTTAMFILFFH